MGRGKNLPRAQGTGAGSWRERAQTENRLSTALCAVLGRPDLAADPRYATNPARVEHRAELLPTIQELLRQRDCDEWIARMMPAGVPTGPINTLDQVLADPQVLARNLVQEVNHPTAGRLPSGLRLDAGPGTRCAPRSAGWDARGPGRRPTLPDRQRLAIPGEKAPGISGYRPVPENAAPSAHR